MDTSLISSVNVKIETIPVNGHAVIQPTEGRLIELSNLAYTGPMSLYHTDGITAVMMLQDTCVTGGSWFGLEMFSRNLNWILVANNASVPIDICYEFATEGSVQEVA